MRITPKEIHILGGGTTSYVAPHLSLCAPAYGTIAKEIAKEFSISKTKMNIVLGLTSMAGGTIGDSLQAVKNHIHKLINNLDTKIVIMSCAICDFKIHTIESNDPNDITGRLNSENQYKLHICAAEKLLPMIRKERKDIFLVGFSTTYNKNQAEMYKKAIKTLKTSSCNLVVANDIGNHHNFIVTPEESIYCVTKDRKELIKELVDICLKRSNLTFTRSTVVDGQPEPWNSPRIPQVLREVVEHCIRQDAYKPILGKTAGHFACKLSDTEFLTSIRKTNFNDLDKIGLVYVKTDGPDTVLAYGAKPSVGGQSQRIIFKDHPEMNCVVHFHCPTRPQSTLSIASQREFECGSHQCGQNTSSNLKAHKIGNTDLKCVYLDKHGPNIIFSDKANAQDIIKFIDQEFDLTQKTGPIWDTGQNLSTTNSF